MSRTLKLILCAAVIEMTLVALANIAWRHGVIPGLRAPGPDNFRVQFRLLWCLGGLVIAWVFAGRRLASDRPRISETHRRYMEDSMKVGTALVVAIQGIVAYADFTGAVLDQNLMFRGAAIFLGVWMTTRGNAAAKIDPPSGDGAPAPGIWTRTLLRFGWIMVALGLGLILCALVVPDPRQLRLVLIAIMVISVALELQYRRMTRPSRTA